MVGIQRHFNAVKSETSEKTNFIKYSQLEIFGFVVADVSDLTASPFCWRIECREKNVHSFPRICCLLSVVSRGRGRTPLQETPSADGL